MFFIDQSGIQKEGLIEVNLAICHMSSKYKNKVIPDSLVPSEPTVIGRQIQILHAWSTD
jgi:hypothetical protein